MRSESSAAISPSAQCEFDARPIDSRAPARTERHQLPSDIAEPMKDPSVNRFMAAVVNRILSGESRHLLEHVLQRLADSGAAVHSKTLQLAMRETSVPTQTKIQLWFNKIANEAPAADNEKLHELFSDTKAVFEEESIDPAECVVLTGTFLKNASTAHPKCSLPFLRETMKQIPHSKRPAIPQDIFPVVVRELRKCLIDDETRPLLLANVDVMQIVEESLKNDSAVKMPGNNDARAALRELMLQFGRYADGAPRLLKVLAKLHGYGPTNSDA